MAAFPAGFLWGASTSAHQVEGGCYHNDWWRWEQRPGRIRDGATSQIASGHYDRFLSDFDLARRLGHTAHLFSIEWSRIEPEPGAYQEEAIAHYRSVFAALEERGLEPICALNHVTIPAWFAAEGGWSHPGAVRRFCEFAQRVLREWAPHGRWWVPFHEPVYTLHMGYEAGAWPPGGRNASAYRAAVLSVARAHVETYRILKEMRPDAQVGVSVRVRDAMPADPESPWDTRVARRTRQQSARAFIDAVAGLTNEAFDYIGVSYYGRERSEFSPWRELRRIAGLGAGVSDRYRDPNPEGLCTALRELAVYARPLIVTGHGMAAEDDGIRCRLLLDHIEQVSRIIAEGIDVRGYIFRSFLDGFEWDEGYTARYGLVHVERGSLARTPNPSAYLFKDICEANAIRKAR